MQEMNRLPDEPSNRDQQNSSHSETELPDQWSQEEKRLRYLEQLKKSGQLPPLLEIELQVLTKRDPMYLEGPGGPLPQTKAPWLK